MKRYKLSLICLALLGLFFSQTNAQNEKPNIIVFMADDAGYADFGFMGSKDLKTPNIDRIAKEGIHFTDAHVTGSVCSPSRAGFLTGRYQQRFGHEMNSPGKGLGMDPSEKTIADALKTAGYKTACFGKWHVGSDEQFHPNNRGFDEFHGILGGHRPYFPSVKADKPGAHTAVQHNGKYTTFTGYYTDFLGDITIDYIDKNKSNPFFVFLSFTAVHTPMQAKKEDLALFKGHPRQTLAAMTWAMDRAVGNVLKKLEDEKLLNNTLIFFLSDNGGSPKNTSSVEPLKGYKGVEFEGGHRVAYAMMWKNKLKGGVTNDQMVSSMDIFATSIKAAGIEKTTGKPLDGVDLVPYLTGENKGTPHKTLFWRMGRANAMRYNNYKMIAADEVGSVLYDLDADITESKNIKDSKTETYSLLRDEYSKWEEGTIEKLWNVSHGWHIVKGYMYKDLFENKKPRIMGPGQLKNLKPEQKEAFDKE